MNNWFSAQTIEVIGIPAIFGGLIYIGAKLQILRDLQNTSEKIKHNVRAISDFLVQNSNFNSKELKDYSPLGLTRMGYELVERTRFDEIFETHKEDFFAFINLEEPKLKYEVEIAAIKAIYALSMKRYMDFLKIYLYSNPDRNMGNIAPTLGVYLRDKYLAAHDEITQ